MGFDYFDYLDRSDNMNTAGIFIPYSYAYDNAELNWYDLKFGIEHEYYKPDAAIDHAFNVLEADENSPKAVLDLASLCLDKKTSFSIHPYIDELVEMSPETDKNNVIDKLLYIILKWIYDNRDRYKDPLETVEYVWEDFMCPPSINFLTKYHSANVKIKWWMSAAKKEKLRDEKTKLQYDKWGEFLSEQSKIWGRAAK